MSGAQLTSVVNDRDAVDRMVSANSGWATATVGESLGKAGKDVFALELVTSCGAVIPAVLKLCSPESETTAEWKALHAAAAAAVGTPEPLAVDTEGSWFGQPSLVMSRLAGKFRPDVSDPDSLRQLAAAIAAIHACSGDGLQDARPRWGTAPAQLSPLEERVWERLRELAPEAGPRISLVHGDLNFTNILWDEARLQGVIDWAGGVRGWPGSDLARCRWYLTVAGAPEAGDALLEIYESLIGSQVPAMALHDAAYAVRILQDAEMRVAGSSSPELAAARLRALARQFVERALGDVR